MNRKQLQRTGDRKRAAGDGQLEQITRRGWIGAVAGVVAAVANLKRTHRDETVVEKRRRRRFWIGHT